MSLIHTRLGSHGSLAAACATAVCLWVAPALGQDEEPLDEVPDNVLQGGFQFSDPEVGPPTSGGGIEGFAFSEGNTVITGGRVRGIQVDPTRISPSIPPNAPNRTLRVCVDLAYTLHSSELIKRKSDEIKEKQREDVLVQFVFFDCPDVSAFDGSPVCVLSQGLPVEQPTCKAFTKTDNGDPAGVEAKVKLKCPDTIDADDPAFDLDADERFYVKSSFPNLIDGLKVKYKDEAASEVPEEDLEALIDPRLGLDDCTE